MIRVFLLALFFYAFRKRNCATSATGVKTLKISLAWTGGRRCLRARLKPPQTCRSFIFFSLIGKATTHNCWSSVSKRNRTIKKPPWFSSVFKCNFSFNWGSQVDALMKMHQLTSTLFLNNMLPNPKSLTILTWYRLNTKTALTPL